MTPSQLAARLTIYEADTVVPVLERPQLRAVGGTAVDLTALRPGGLLAAAAITRFASTFDGVVQGFLLEPGFEEIVERDLADGQHRNPDAHPRWFTTAYFHLPDELEREVAAAGFEGIALVAVEGAVGAAAEAHALDGWLDDPGRREILLRAIRRVEAEPSLLGASPHLLAVATRP